MITLEYARGHVHARTYACLKRLLAAAFLGVGLAAVQVGEPAASAGEPARNTLAVLPFEIKDTSGEVGAPDRHDAMLARLTRFVGARIAAAEIMDVVDQIRVGAAVTAANPGTYLRNCNGCERDIAKSVGADLVMIGWLFKVSTLVLSLHVVVKDVASGQILYARTFDFRGDNEKAWTRAADYMVDALARSTKREIKSTN